jgi:uncharacterized protein
MEIVVFGSTGRVGSALVERALDQGIGVTAFARDPSKLARIAVVGAEDLRIVQGDASDPAAVTDALAGSDAAVSALGAGTLEASTYLHDITHTVVAAMQEHGPRRLVVVSHVGVLLTKVDPQYQHVADEHRRNLAMLQASDLDWIAVCPPGIVNEPAHGHVEAVVGKRAPNWTISRYDLADFMLDQVAGDSYLRRTVGISN